MASSEGHTAPVTQKGHKPQNPLPTTQKLVNNLSDTVLDLCTHVGVKFDTDKAYPTLYFVTFKHLMYHETLLMPADTGVHHQF